MLPFPFLSTLTKNRNGQGLVNGVGYSASDWSVTDTYSLAVFSKVRLVSFEFFMMEFLSTADFFFLPFSQPQQKHTKQNKNIGRDPRRDEDRRLLLPGKLPQRQRQRREALLEERQGEEEILFLLFWMRVRRAGGRRGENQKKLTPRSREQRKKRNSSTLSTPTSPLASRSRRPRSTSSQTTRSRYE